MTNNIFQVPSPPLNVKTNDVTSTSITIIWEPPQSPNGRLLGYEVSYTPNGGQTSVVGIPQYNTSWKLTCLKPHAVYSVQVRAKTMAGFGSYSLSSNVSTLEDGMLIYELHGGSLRQHRIKHIGNLGLVTCTFYH